MAFPYRQVFRHKSSLFASIMPYIKASISDVGDN